MRACREMGIGSVEVYPEAEKDFLFVKCEAGRETTLPDDIRAIIEQDFPLELKLYHSSEDKKRMAAISAGSTMTQVLAQKRTSV
jgi:hypothetical protein